MSRSDFKAMEIPVDDLLLDFINPRIRTAHSQEECIAKVIRKEKQLMNLIKSIAKDGLTTMPIIAMPSKDKKQREKWIVKDGNRRVTALKLLNDPSLCPEKHLQGKILELHDKYHNKIPTSIECLVSDNIKAVSREVLARHSGAQDGVGQLDWSAYLSTVYAIGNKHSAKYKNAGMYLFWAEQEGIFVDDDFPITNINRFLNKENINLLGMEIIDDELKPIVSKNKAKIMATKIIADFGESQLKVRDVFTPKAAKEYLDEVRRTAGFMSENDDIEDSKQDGTTSSTDGKDRVSRDSDVEKKESDQNISNPNPRPIPPSWDRNKLFSKASPRPTIPVSYKKERDFIANIDNIDIRKAPLAVAMLLRGLIELSAEHYMVTHGIAKKKGLANNIAACADSMFNKGFLSVQQQRAVNALAKTDRSHLSLIAIESLQQMLHHDTHFPNFQTLNTMWDEINPFVLACWKK